MEHDITLKRKHVEWVQHNFIVLYFMLCYFIWYNLFISLDSYYTCFSAYTLDHFSKLKRRKVEWDQDIYKYFILHNLFYFDSFCTFNFAYAYLLHIQWSMTLIWRFIIIIFF